MMRYLFYRSQKQYNKQWCWAAVAASISRFYNGHSNWWQCRIVSHSLSNLKCCTIPTPTICDTSYQLEIALSVTKNYRSFHNQALNTTQIQTEIDNFRIIGARIRWNYTRGHFVAIHGYNYNNGDEFVAVGDPLKGSKWIELYFFSNNYDSVGGTWSHTYLTQPNNPPDMIKYSIIDSELLRRAKKLVATRLRGGSAMGEVSSHGYDLKFYPHSSFVINFESARNREAEIRFAGLRLIDSYRNDMIVVDFDLKNNDVALQQIFYDTRYTKPYFETLKFAIARYSSGQQQFELRIIAQPEINVEAFWLHDLQSETRDVFILLSGISGSNERQIYSRNAFLEIIYRETQAVEISDNDLLGN